MAVAVVVATLKLVFPRLVTQVPVIPLVLVALAHLTALQEAQSSMLEAAEAVLEPGALLEREEMVVAERVAMMETRLRPEQQIQVAAEVVDKAVLLVEQGGLV